MTGSFNGITDKEWNLLKFCVPKKKTKMGRPYRSFREIFNSMIFVLIEGIRWSSLPRGSKWAPKSTTHFWLGKLEQSGAFQKTLHRILAIAKNLKAVDLSAALIDGSFVPGKGGGDSVEYGYKGKGSTVHLLADRNGMPIVHITTAANGDERQQVMKLLQNKAIPRDNSLQKCHADKGYDAQWLRDDLLNIGIIPAIPYRIMGKISKEKIAFNKSLGSDRLPVERAFSQQQRRYRKTTVKWERRDQYWNGFMNLSHILTWIKRLFRVFSHKINTILTEFS